MDGKLDLIALIKELTGGDSRLSREEHHYFDFEEILQPLAQLNKNGNYQDFINIVVDAYIAIKCPGKIGFSGWSHTLCHAFEGYGGRHTSELCFLNSQHNFTVATKLIEEAVKRAVESGELGCVDRIINPTIKYNIDHLDVEELDGVFPFKPSGLSKPAFVNIVAHNEYVSCLTFVSAQTPREMLIKLIMDEIASAEKSPEHSMSKYFDNLSPKKLAAMLEKLLPDIGQQKTDQFLKLSLQEDKVPELSLEELKAKLKLSESASELVEGVFVDIDGTLIIVDKGVEQLRPGILEVIKKMEEHGKKITLFTGGDPEFQNQKLQKLGLEPKFLPVQPKSAYAGKILEMMIDDTRPEFQGLKALQHRYPLEAEYSEGKLF